MLLFFVLRKFSKVVTIVVTKSRLFFNIKGIYFSIMRKEQNKDQLTYQNGVDVLYYRKSSILILRRWIVRKA